MSFSTLIPGGHEAKGRLAAMAMANDDISKRMLFCYLCGRGFGTARCV
jgi:hypothetical protein